MPAQLQHHERIELGLQLKALAKHREQFTMKEREAESDLEGEKRERGEEGEVLQQQQQPPHTALINVKYTGVDTFAYGVT